ADQAGQVIYTGTFSKVLFPGLRVGYVVAAPQLLEKLALARWNTDVTTERLHALLDYFVDEGEASAAKAALLHATLERADRYLGRGMTAAYLSQLAAFGDQAQDLAPVHVSSDAADALEGEADRLAAS
ncbi:MAG: FIMAH domain-containing protein, partial [Acidimicrobiales bacterium]